MNSKLAQEKILQLLDKRGGVINARDKLIPHISRQLGTDCHETWPALEHALGKLKDKGIVQLTYHGSVMRGVEKILDDSILEEANDTPEVQPVQEGTIVSTEITHPTQAAVPADEAKGVTSGEFKNLPLHERLSLALLALQHQADENGLIRDASSETLITAELKIPRAHARELNRELWRLGLRHTKARLKQHTIDMSISEVTTVMVAALAAPASESEAKQLPLVEAVSSEVATTESLASLPASSGSVTTVERLEAFIQTVIPRLEADNARLTTANELAAGERDAAHQKLTELEQEMLKVRQETGRLVARLRGEREEARAQLQRLRDATQQPLQLAQETQDLLARYEPCDA